MGDDEPETVETVLASTNQPTVDAGTLKGLNAQERENELRRRDRAAFWRGVLSTETGRREIWNIIAGLDQLHAFNTNFPVGPVGFPDPNAAWYQRGQQDYGLKLYHDLLTVVPQEALLMHNENDARFQKPARKSRTRKNPDALSS